MCHDRLQSLTSAGLTRVYPCRVNVRLQQKMFSEDVMKSGAVFLSLPPIFDEEKMSARLSPTPTPSPTLLMMFRCDSLIPSHSFAAN